LETASEAPDAFHFSDTEPMRPPRAAEAADAEMEADLSSLSAMLVYWLASQLIVMAGGCAFLALGEGERGVGETNQKRNDPEN
jgi:hypothetical protein